MKVLNFDEMVEKFGLGYTYHTDFNDPNKVIVSQIFKGVGDSINGEYETKEQAFDAYIKKKKEARENEIRNLESVLSQLSFFSKIFNRTNIKNAKEKLEKWKTTSISAADIKIAHKQISENSICEIDMPELKIGDKVFVAVTSQNVVEEGVYEQEINRMSYYLSPNSINQKYDSDEQVEKFSLGITYEVSTKDNTLSNNLSKKMDIETETELHNGYTYHHTFCDKEKAIAFFNKKMLEKVEYYKSKVIK